eukprot:1585264-Amphidinium_carterae.2
MVRGLAHMGTEVYLPPFLCSWLWKFQDKTCQSFCKEPGSGKEGMQSVQTSQLSDWELEEA